LAQSLIDGLQNDLFDQQSLSIELRKRLGEGPMDSLESAHILRLYLTQELGRKQRNPNSLAFFSNLMETHSFYVSEDGSAGIGPTTLKRGDLIGSLSPFYVKTLGRGSVLCPVLRSIAPTLQDAPKYIIVGYVIHRKVRDENRDRRDSYDSRDRRKRYDPSDSDDREYRSYRDVRKVRSGPDIVSFRPDPEIDIFRPTTRYDYEDSNDGAVGGSVSVSPCLPSPFVQELLSSGSLSRFFNYID
jgi:hypothetical protein